MSELGPGRLVSSSVAHGFLLLDKPAGPSSHDIVAQVRRVRRLRRVGHLGTLDPAATGLLPLALGLATRLTAYAQGHDKQYRTVWQLGQETDTGDQQGQVVAQASRDRTISSEQLQQVLARFEGEIEQVPPVVSAVRVRGRHSYEWARAGQPQPLPARQVRIHRLAWLGWRLGGVTEPWQPPPAEPAALIPATAQLWLELDCSAGTYVRALARDVGRCLGLGATVVELCRTRVGPFQLSQAHSLDQVLAATADQLCRWLLPLEAVLPGSWPRLIASADLLARIKHGSSFPADASSLPPGSAGPLLVLDSTGRLWAIAKPVQGNTWQPDKVFLWEEDEESTHDAQQHRNGNS